MGRRSPGPDYHWRGCLEVQPQVCGGAGPWVEGCRRRGGLAEERPRAGRR